MTASAHGHRARVWARRVTRSPHRDDGRAIVEFIFVGILLLIPMIYLVLVVARIQSAAFAVGVASREAGRAFTTSPDNASAPVRARDAAELPFEDFGFGPDGTVAISCDGSPCLRPEGRVTTTATVTVPLPFVPDFVRGALPTSIPVSATHVAVVDRFSGR